MSREQGDAKIDLGSTKNYFGEHPENNSGSQEKRVKIISKGARSSGPPPLYGVSVVEIPCIIPGIPVTGNPSIIINYLV